MNRPLLLDLFCCAGGAAEGYYRAGFDILGVDIQLSKHYPFSIIKGDALSFLGWLIETQDIRQFAAIHASPPCQDYSQLAAPSRGKRKKADTPRLIAATQTLLHASGRLWVLENVLGAKSELANAITICGTSVGLRVRRHRLFQSNALLFAAGSCQHRRGDVSVRCSGSDYLEVPSTSFRIRNGKQVARPAPCYADDARKAMGIDWLVNQRELGEAIPPAYTEWIGRQLLWQIEATA